MVNRVALCVGVVVLAASSACSVMAALPGVSRVSSLQAQAVPCPPYDAPTPAVLHRVRRPSKPPLLFSSAVNHSVRVKPKIKASVRPHPVHHAVKGAAFQIPSFLEAAAAQPGRCQIVERGPGGDAPELVSYLTPASAEPVEIATDSAPPAPGAASLPGDDAPGAFGAPFGPGFGAPGGLGPARLLRNDVVPPVVGPPPLLPVSDIPEPGTWALLSGGVFLVGCSLRRRRSRSSQASSGGAPAEPRS